MEGTPVMHQKGVKTMSDMKRMSISIPDEMEEAIIMLRKTDRFCRSSLAEIIREVLTIGLEQMDKKDCTQES